MSGSTATTWLLVVVVVLLLVVLFLVAWIRIRWTERYANLVMRDQMLSRQIAELEPDYVISITDWGEEFEGTDMRWRWVLWKGKNKESVPIDLGNDNHPWTVWDLALEAVESHHPDPFTPRLLVQWRQA